MPQKHHDKKDDSDHAKDNNASSDDNEKSDAATSVGANNKINILKKLILKK